jgi:hypothetical protein
MRAERPAGVTAVAILFLLAATYLMALAIIMLLRPGAVALAEGAPLLGGLEIAGPYMFVLSAVVAWVIAIGLLRLHMWLRRLAILVALLGVVFLLPTVSSAVVDGRTADLAWGGLGMIIRVVVAWYLHQMDTREAFTTK